jgi:hypothetical protein
MIYTFKEIAGSSYYRSRPVASLQFLYSKWAFARKRVKDPEAMLEMIGLDPVAALDGFEKWSDVLERVVFEVARHWGQGGINMPEGRFLFGITRALHPDVVIETGVAAGVSSSFFIAALLENQKGDLYSVDLPTDGTPRLDCADASRYSWPEKGVAWAIPPEMSAQISSRHHLILEDVRNALPRLLKNVGQVDVFFHDDLHLPEHMLWEYQSVWPYLREGGVLASHDVNMGWIRFCREHGIPRERLVNLNRLCAVRKT